jgi:hypothetical protein
LFINTEQPQQDIRDRTAGTRQSRIELGQDNQDRTARKDSNNRKAVKDGPIQYCWL